MHATVTSAFGSGAEAVGPGLGGRQAGAASEVPLDARSTGMK